MYRPNLQSVALPVPGIAVRVLGGGCEPPILEKGSGMVPFDRALASSYRPSIVTFRLSLRVSEILPLLCSVLQHATFPTPSLSVSPKFSHVPLGVGGWPAYVELRCWAYVGYCMYRVRLKK